MSGPSGSTIAVITKGGVANAGCVVLGMTGTYTAADFTVGPADGLPFTPSKVVVHNLSDRIKMTQWVLAALDAGSNAKGLKQVAAGTATYEATGIAVTDRLVTIDVSVALITANDDVVMEFYR